MLLQHLQKHQSPTNQDPKTGQFLVDLSEDGASGWPGLTRHSASGTTSNLPTPRLHAPMGYKTKPLIEASPNRQPNGKELAKLRGLALILRRFAPLQSQPSRRRFFLRRVSSWHWRGSRGGSELLLLQGFQCLLLRCAHVWLLVGNLQGVLISWSTLWLFVVEIIQGQQQTSSR